MYDSHTEVENKQSIQQCHKPHHCTTCREEGGAEGRLGLGF